MDNKQNEKKPHFRRHHRRGRRPNKKDHTKAPVAGEAVEEKEISAAPVQEETVVNDTPFLSLPAEEQEEKASPEKKIEVIGVRFRPVGKSYSFDPEGKKYAMGDEVIVETSQGKEFGVVSTGNHLSPVSSLVLPLKKVVRFADQKDKAQNKENRELELKARKVFQEKVISHKLDMALSDVECSFDRSKLIFYFTSEGRVDFREFVKDMASVFKTRIELRQIGVRDEAKQLGGLGICGRPLCCSSFLEDFQQVSIKMAKEQNLSLNPTKISGTCGRLMCCLRYENDVYVEASRRCPKADQCVMTPQGQGVVLETNVLCERCKVKLDSDPDNIFVFPAADLKVLSKQKKAQNSARENVENAENKPEGK